MSSHHFVREDQEPALFIYDFHPARDQELLGQLLEWSPRVYAYALVAERLFNAGFKVDTILYLSTEEKQKAIYLQKIQGHISLIKISGSEKVLTTPLSALLHYLPSDDLNILNAPLCSVQDFLHNKAGRAVAFYWDCGKAMVIANGRYRKWLPSGTLLELVADTGNLDLSQATNLDPIDRQSYIPDAAVYKVLDSGPVIVYRKGAFILFETA